MSGATRQCALILFAAGLLVSCGGLRSPDAPKVEGAWARPTPPGAPNGVVYLVLTSDRADSLVAATVATSVAAGVELHATRAETGAGGHSHGDIASGAVTMSMVERFDLLPGRPLVFEPGGNHLMLVDLAEPLRSGERFRVTLRLGSGRTIDADVVVTANRPRSGP